jgi:hypothetical protein
MQVGEPDEVMDLLTRVIDSSERSSEARPASVSNTSGSDGGARVASSPTRVNGSSERLCEQLDFPQMATLPEVTTSTGGDRRWW